MFQETDPKTPNTDSAWSFIDPYTLCKFGLLVLIGMHPEIP